jgi:hypothetical protein
LSIFAVDDKLLAFEGFVPIASIPHVLSTHDQILAFAGAQDLLFVDQDRLAIRRKLAIGFL